MRVVALVSAALILFAAPSASGQDWAEFVSRADGFRVNFPGQPAVSTTTFKSEYGADLPARVFTVISGRERYSMTVVDYSPIEAILTAKSKQCPPFADERCTGVGAGRA